MIYNLDLQDLNGNKSTWKYDVEKNVFSSDNDKIRNINFLSDINDTSQQIRIVLGQNCNYKCSYCTQNLIKNGEQYTTKDIKKYVTYLKKYYDTYYTPHTKKIHFTFWGGEPFLYINEIKLLVSEIREQFSKEFSDIRFGTVTNGSLLKGDVFKYITDENISVTISYDGPGQFVRNKQDIFDKGTETRESAMEILKNKGIISLSAVFHKYNPSTLNYINWTKDKLETENFMIGEMYYNRVYDELGKNFACTKEQLEQDTAERLQLFLLDEIPQMRFVYLKRIEKFFKTLGKTEVKSDCQSFSQNKFFAADMAGHLWGCHNVKNEYVDEYGNNIYKGNIYTGEHNILEFAALKKRLPRCKDCLLRWICCGGCPYTPSKYDDINCQNYWYFYYTFFAHTIYLMSNKKIITGINIE